MYLLFLFKNIFVQDTFLCINLNFKKLLCLFIFDHVYTEINRFLYERIIFMSFSSMYLMFYRISR